MSELVFRGVKGRTGDDQIRAMEAGYHSIVEMAVDELGQMLLELTKRVEALEAHLSNVHATSFQQTPPMHEARGIWTDTTRDSDAG